MKLRLIKPSLGYKEEILRYKNSFTFDKLNGGGGILSYDNVEDWLEYLEIMSSEDTCPSDRVLSDTYLCVNENDKIVGMCNIRHNLSLDYLINTAGHIGYSIDPSERRKGYAKEQLRLALIEAKKLGIDRVLITCNDHNVGSRKTILANGGVLEDTRFDDEDKEMMERYWIENK